MYFPSVVIKLHFSCSSFHSVHFATKIFFKKVFMAQRKLNPSRKWCSALSLAPGKKWEKPWNPRTYEMPCRVGIGYLIMHFLWPLQLTGLRFGAFLNCELYYLNRWILANSWSRCFFQTCASTTWFHRKTINRSGSSCVCSGWCAVFGFHCTVLH